MDACALYNYDEFIRELLFQVKGNGDYELAKVFLNNIHFILRVMYRGFIIIPAPSFCEQNEKRGFNHVEAIFEQLCLPLCRAFDKTANIKQTKKNSRERREIQEVIVLRPNIDLKNRKILLVDDVITTGSTLKAMINLFKDSKFREIRILTMSKTLNYK